MLRFRFLLWIVWWPWLVNAASFTVYSDQVKDSFQIEVYEEFLDSSLLFHTYYILDSQIDNRAEDLLDSLRAEVDFNIRVIGIGHMRFSNVLRKRDFIPSAQSLFYEDNVGFHGEAEEFKKFVYQDIVKVYDENSEHRTLIGHSFGGVFAVFVAMQNDSIFNNVVSLSPSLWLNHSGFIKKYDQDSSVQFYIKLSVLFGNREVINKVGPSCKEFEKKVRMRDERNCVFIEIPRCGHNDVLDFYIGYIVDDY